MTDREKVINDLEQCLDDSVVAVVPADTVRDAIALLKAQEPIEARLNLCDSCAKLYEVENPLILYLALYAPAPENAPDDWYHHGDENLEAWHEFVMKSRERGYYAFPLDNGANGALAWSTIKKDK